MSNPVLHKPFFLLFALLLAAILTHGIKTEGRIVQSSEPLRELKLQSGNWGWRKRNVRRVMIGSTAPTCTFNECRGCRYKCTAEQVPVEGDDPFHSPYHYRCVCHRS